MYRAERPATRTIQARGLVQKANGIKPVPGWIIGKQDTQSSSHRRQSDPYKGVYRAAGRSINDGRSMHRNAPFTSGFASTTSAQIPIGKPTIQHGEMQGTRARILEAIARL